MAQRARTAGLLLVLLMVLGCEAELAVRVPVSGTVRYRGQLLTGGTVVLVPDVDRGGGDELVIGAIGRDGAFTLKVDQQRGVLAGWYKVTIAGPPYGFHLPDRYRDPNRSGLTCEVQPNHHGQTVNFNLE